MSRNRIGVRRPIRGAQTISFPFTITSVVPAAIALGAGPTTVDVFGEDFLAGDVVWVGGVAFPTTPISATNLRITFSAADASVPGVKPVIVRRGSLHSNSRSLVVPYPVPTVVSANFDGVDLAVGGTGFYPEGTYALIDGAVVAPYTYLTSTTCSVAVPQAVIDIPGDHLLQIINPPPGGGASNSVAFPVKFGPALLAGMTPLAQFRGRPSGTVTLRGDPDPNLSSFYSVSTVQVDGADVPSAFVDAQHMTFSISGAILMAAGSHLVTVTNPTVGGGGGVSNALTFTSLAPDFDAISISDVPQYFDGFDVTGHVDFIDSNFEATFGGVPQPTTILDANNFVVHMTSAAIAVPGVTTIRLRDTLSGATTNAQMMTVHAWDPSRLGATLRYWGDGGSLVDDGTGKAQAWDDKSGGGRHFVQATSAKRPAIVAAAGLNNMLAARFSAAALQFLTYTPWLVSEADGLIQKDRYTIYAVAMHTGAGTGQTLLGETNGYIYVGSTTVGPLALISGDSSGSGNSAWTVAFDWLPPPAKPFMLRFRKGSGNCAARVNRSAELVQTHGSSLASFAPVLAYIGAKGATQGPSNADIAEVVICDSNLNATQRALLDNRFSFIYGLPFGTPGTQPVISSIAPVACNQYDLPFWIVVTDAAGGYTTATVVNAFDQILVTEYLSPTQVRARMTNDVLAQAGGMPITVASETGISAPVGLTIFAYVDVPGKPNIHTTIPNVGQRFGAPLFVRVLGVGFTAASVIKWNGNAIATTFVSATEVTGTLPVQALDVLPGPILTVDDPAGLSPNSAEITLSDWSPLSIPGLTGWWAVDDVITSAGKITQFNDKSGNGRHFVQADTAKQALYSASDAAFNGKPSAQFDGVDDTYAGPATSIALGNASSVFASVYRYLVVDGAGIPSQPFVNDCMITGTNYGVSAHLSPLTLLGFASDGSYRTVANPNLVVNATQRCQFRITSLVMTIEIGDTVSPTYTLASLATSNPLNLCNVNFGTLNAMNGKLAVWITTNLAWSAETSIRWGNFCRYNYGTAA